MDWITYSDAEDKEPTTEEPTLEQLEDFMFGGYCDATDGCMVEPDGIC